MTYSEPSQSILNPVWVKNYTVKIDYILISAVIAKMLCKINTQSICVFFHFKLGPLNIQLDKIAQWICGKWFSFVLSACSQELSFFPIIQLS